MSAVVRFVRRCRSALEQRLLIRAGERSSEPYATHMPVLVAIAGICAVRRVLELGGGLYSTPLFLRRDVFADLVKLTVVETDPEWMATVRETVDNDARAAVVLTRTTAEFLSSAALVNYDIVFIDDSTRPEDRISTIRSVAAAQSNAIVVVHDFDVAQYRKAARQLGRPVVFRRFNPQTAVFARSRSERANLRRLRRRINATSGVDPKDVEEWLLSFGQEASAFAHAQGSDRDNIAGQHRD